MTETASPSPSSETHEFSAEVGRLLDLVVHSLYSEREIFLRELVANAADATDRRRFEALTDGARALPENAHISISPDKDARLLTIRDDGTGMSREELVSNLGTIARSGTRAFGQQLENAKPEDKPSLIGQFGVGFYAAFMVADKVDVVSRRAGSDEAWRWSSDGKGAYTLEPATRDTAGPDLPPPLTTDAAALDTIKGLGYLQAPVVTTDNDHWSGFRPDKIATLAERAAPLRTITAHSAQARAGQR